MWPLLVCLVMAEPSGSALDAPPSAAVAPSAVPSGPTLSRAIPPKGDHRGNGLPTRGDSRASSPSRKTAGQALVTAGASLAIVLGLFSLLAWAVKRRMPDRGATLPSEAVEVLGRFPLGARQHVHLLRCGSKLLLVSISPSGVETLTEITEPREVNHLLSICQRHSPHGTTAAFRDVLERLGRERAPLA